MLWRSAAAGRVSVVTTERSRTESGIMPPYLMHGMGPTISVPRRGLPRRPRGLCDCRQEHASGKCYAVLKNIFLLPTIIIIGIAFISCNIGHFHHDDCPQICPQHWYRGSQFEIIGQFPIYDRLFRPTCLAYFSPFQPKPDGPSQWSPWSHV